MEKHHHNHHHHHLLSENITGDLKKVYICAIILNALFVAFEAWMGFRSDAMSLVSDAGHKLVDVFSLGLTLTAFILASSRPGKKFTIGFRKLTVLISLLNAVFVVIVSVSIIYESIQRMMDPASLSPDADAISITAGVGIVVNFLSVVLLSFKRRHDVNTRGAFLHMLTDCLLSIGVVIAGFIIKWTGFVLLDPIISICIAGFILASIMSVLVESFKLSIDAVPAGIDAEKISKEISGIPGVNEVSGFHIWPISTTEAALTAKLSVDDSFNRSEILSRAKDIIKSNGINDSTLEIQ